MSEVPVPIRDDSGEPDALRQLFAEAGDTAPVHYDLSAGLARHEVVIAAQTPTPAWAASGPAASGGLGLGTVVALFGAAATATAIAVYAWPAPDPEPPTVPAAGLVHASIDESERVSSSPTEEPTTTPPVEESLGAREVAPRHASSPRKAKPQSIARDRPDPLDEAERSSTPEADPVQREIAQMAKARALLGRNPQEALSRLDATAREFPHGFLVEERRALRVLALDALGREEAAAKAAKAFLDTYPGSTFEKRVRATRDE